MFPTSSAEHESHSNTLAPADLISYDLPGHLIVRWGDSAPPVVLELKYALEHEAEAAWVAQQIPFRLT